MHDDDITGAISDVEIRRVAAIVLDALKPGGAVESEDDFALLGQHQLRHPAWRRSPLKKRLPVIAITAPVANRAARGRANYKWLGSRDIAQ